MMVLGLMVGRISKRSKESKMNIKEQLKNWYDISKSNRAYKKHRKANPFPRAMATVVAHPEALKNYEEDIFGKDLFIYFGEVPNDNSHCIVQRLRHYSEESEQGKKYGYLPFKAHCYEFKEATDEDMGYVIVNFDKNGNVIESE